MNRRERRHGRMFLLPLLLGLSGIALLVLEWVLQLRGSGSGVLDAAMRAGSFKEIFGFLKSLGAILRPNLVILVLPLILLVLYLIRIPPKAARIASLVLLAAALFHVIVVLYCGGHAPNALFRKVPGYGLLAHAKNMRLNKNADSALLTFADAAFVLSTVSSVFTCLIYSLVKARSEERNEAFDQRNAYLINAGSPAPAVRDVPAPAPAVSDSPAVSDGPAVSDEPTRVLELPPKDFQR